MEIATADQEYVEEVTRRIKGLVCKKDIPGYDDNDWGLVEDLVYFIIWLEVHSFVYKYDISTSDLYWNEKACLALELDLKRKEFTTYPCSSAQALAYIADDLWQGFNDLAAEGFNEP